MKYLEIRDGLSIAVEKITAVAADPENNLKSIVWIDDQKYSVTFPYSTLMGLLMSYDEPVSPQEEKLEGMYNIMKEMGITSP